MIEVKQVDSYCCLLHVTPAMQKLVNHLNMDVNYSVGLVPAGYYATFEEACRGAFGYAGPIVTDRENFDDSVETLNITLTVNNNFIDIMDHIKQLASNLDVTMGGRDNKHEPLSITINDKYEMYTKTFYYCKRPGFDDLFKGLQTIIPTLTEENMVNYYVSKEEYNSYIQFWDCKEELKEGDVVFKTETKSGYKRSIDIENYTVTLSVISTDIERNFDLICDLLQQIYKYKI